MGVDGGQALQGQYTAKWLELKHALTAKYFSNKDLAGSCACMQDLQCLHIRYALTKPLQSVNYLCVARRQHQQRGGFSCWRGRAPGVRTTAEALPEDAAPEGGPGQVRVPLRLGWQARSALQGAERGATRRYLDAD